MFLAFILLVSISEVVLKPVLASRSLLLMVIYFAYAQFYIGVILTNISVLAVDIVVGIVSDIVDHVGAIGNLVVVSNCQVV